MIAFRSVFFLIGVLITIITLFMVIPLGVEFFIYQTNHWKPFGIAIFISGFIGSTLALAFKPDDNIQLKVREVFLLTTLSWVLISLFAGLPFYMSNKNISFVDACFESVSGLTTTGASAFTNLESFSRGFLLWRALLHWLGGVGIIVMAMTILPILRIGGMQLFRSEFSDRSEKILPRVSQIAQAILITYVFLSFLCAILLKIAGMSWFDAICHSMSTLSTGGFSTKTDSIGFYKSPAIDVIITIFMIIGGTTLLMYVKLWNRDFSVLKKDTQLHLYLLVLAVPSLIIAVWRHFAEGVHFLESLRQSTFTVASLITTTGFTNCDYSYWGNFATIILLFIMNLGGCTGSTTGGIKTFRLKVLLTLAKTHLKQLRRPHGVYFPTYQGQKIDEGIAISVFTFVTLYSLSLSFLTLSLGACGLDFITSFSGASTSLANVGTAFGQLSPS
ncbi:MAG: TrkH family potassium uptake protein, partial [Proteobacteria bacterium]|nr:TrkH family potassium uptake protein [Pseudomonadota bacterium]